MTRLGTFVVVLVGMAGLRVDRLRQGGVYWAAAVVWTLTAAGGAAASGLAGRRFALGYAAAMWLVYYGGNTLLLGSATLRGAMIRRWGEEGAWARYEALLGLVYQSQALCQSVLVSAFAVTLPGVPAGPAFALGAALVVVGTGVKAWATVLTGLDTYYYRDMFVGRGHGGPLVTTGPYRVVANPMYSVGYLSGYGLALLSRSMEGLVCAAVFHASIYAFYLFLERPFVRRVYAV